VRAGHLLWNGSIFEPFVSEVFLRLADMRHPPPGGDTHLQQYTSFFSMYDVNIFYLSNHELTRIFTLRAGSVSIALITCTSQCVSNEYMRTINATATRPCTEARCYSSV